MGLDASVMCNCFRDGKTTQPPFPREWFEIDEEGYLNLKSAHNSDTYWHKNHMWQQICCEHKGMDYASERISNWTGYRLFQAALGEIGWQHFPTLKEQLPNLNGGQTPSVDSARALVELDAFMAAGEIAQVTILVNTASGEPIHEYVAAYGGVFLQSGKSGINAGVSEEDFFAVESESGKMLFRSRHFKQHAVNGKKVEHYNEKVVWQDVQTGISFESDMAICGKRIAWQDGTWEKPDGTCRFDYPTEFHVERRSKNATQFDYVVRPLQKVFKASVETGNPVRWC